MTKSRLERRETKTPSILDDDDDDDEDSDNDKNSEENGDDNDRERGVVSTDNRYNIKYTRFSKANNVSYQLSRNTSKCIV